MLEHLVERFIVYPPTIFASRYVAREDGRGGGYDVSVIFGTSACSTSGATSPAF